MQFTDRLLLDGAPRRTSDGYAVLSARVARGGNVQRYLGAEFGMADKAIVRVYRPEGEVFARDALRTYAGVPVTVGHPTARVTADTWRDLAVGEVGDEVLRDGEFVRVPMILRDANAIRRVEAGTRELSMGYEAEITMSDGVSPSGEQYDAVMTNFRMNHVAIVDHARGGTELRIGDHAEANKWGAAPITLTTDKEKVTMSDTLRTVVVDGLSVLTTDHGALAIDKLTKALADRDTAKDKLVSDHATALAAKDGELAKKDAEIDALKAKVLDDAAIDARVQARGDLIAKAKAIAADVATDGKSDVEIRRAVVVAKLGDAAVKDKPAAYVDARFDILAENLKSDPLRGTIKDGVKPNTPASATAAYDAMVSDLTGAWNYQKGAA